MKKKSFIVSIIAALFAVLVFSGCDCCKKKKHHAKSGDCASCQCPAQSDNGAVIVTEEDALFEVAPDSQPAAPAKK